MSSIESQPERQRDQPSRKRFRITLVCNVCKSRKVKCDRKHPCTSCTKYNTTHLCSYDEQMWNTPQFKRDFPLPAKDSEKSLTLETELRDLREKLVKLESVVLESKDSPGTHHIPSPPVSIQYNSIQHILSNFKNLNSVIGTNPVGSNEDEISFYSTFGTIQRPHDYNKAARVDYAPFTFYSMLRRDTSLLDLWYFITQRRDALLNKGGNEKPNPIAANQTSSFASEKEQSHRSILMQIRKYSEAKFNNKRLSPSINSPGIIAQTSSSDTSSAAVAISEESIILPKDAVIWQYVDVFFARVYSYYPFIDEITFRGEVERIIATRQEGCGLKIEEKKDFAILGQLCIVMRLSYLSYIPNKNKINDTEYHEKVTKDLHVIGVEYVDLAKRCLNCFDLVQAVDLSMVQCCLMVALYLTVAPEDGDGPDRNQFQILASLLVQMAQSIALNRDPKKFLELSKSPRIDHLRRKIWNEIVQIDLKSATTFGNAPLIQQRYYDASLPFYTEGCENVIGNPAVEKEVVETIEFRDTFYEKTKEFVETILDMRGGLKVYTVTNYLSEIESMIQKEFGSATPGKAYGFKDTMKLKSIFSLRIFHTFLYFDLFLYYERNNNQMLSFFYLKKIISISMEEFFPHYFNLLSIFDGQRPEKNGDSTNFISDLILNPAIEQLVHRTNGIVLSLLVRIKYTLHTGKFEEKSPLQEELKKLATVVSNLGKGSVVSISQLSDRYWYAWRIAKSHSYILNSVLNDEYYANIDECVREEPLHKIYFSADQVKDLRHTLEKSLMKYRKRGIGRQWKAVSDYSEATSNGETDDSLSINSSTPSHTNSTINNEFTSFWESTELPSNSNFQNFFGLTSTDFEAIMEQKEFKDVMDNYFDLNAPFLDSFGQFSL